MVLYLGASIAHAGRDWTVDELDFFSTLASFHRKGNNCYLCGDRNTLKTLKDCVRLGEVPRMVYATLFRDRQQQIVIDKVCTVFVLTLQETEVPDTLPDGAPEKWRFLRIEDAIREKWSLWQSCGLLVENRKYDGRFYEYIAEDWLTRKGTMFRNIVRYHCESLHGGGVDIASGLLGTVRENRRPTLCVVDTDQRHGNLVGYAVVKGKTLDAVETADKELTDWEGEQKNNWAGVPPQDILPPRRIYVLSVHEIENLIPLELLKELANIIPNLDPDYNDALAMLEKLKNLSVPSSLTYTDGSRTYRLDDYRVGDPLLYYDFKKGIPYVPGYATDKYGNLIMSKIPDDKEKGVQAYWEIILSALYQCGAVSAVSCTTNRQCIFPRLHKKILGHALQFLDTHPNWRSSITLEPRLQMIWDEIGQLLFTWGCVSVKMRDDALEVLEITRRFAPAPSTIE